MGASEGIYQGSGMDGGIITSKVCNGCKVDKPLTDYHLRADRKDGRRTKCRLCENPRISANRRDRRKKNPEIWRKKNNEYNKRRGDVHLDKRRKLYANNKERYKGYSKAYEERNPERFKFLNNRKNARRKMRVKSNGDYSYREIRAIRKMQKVKCAYCKKCIKKKHHIDHIMPLALGGSNEAKNIQLLCPPCNHRKSCKDPMDYMRENGFLL